MLETSYAKNIILDAIENKVTIIEVNPEPIIELGNTYTLAGPSEEILPQLLSWFYFILNKKKNYNK